MIAEDGVGDESGDSHDLPSRRSEQPLAKIVEIRDAGLRHARDVETREKLRRGATGEHAS